jgi:hypothetical protein
MHLTPLQIRPLRFATLLLTNGITAYNIEATPRLLYKDQRTLPSPLRPEEPPEEKGRYPKKKKEMGSYCKIEDMPLVIIT